MARKRKRRPKWFLLYRKENGQKIYLYEPLKKYELKSRKKEGWKIIN